MGPRPFHQCADPDFSWKRGLGCEPNCNGRFLDQQLPAGDLRFALSLFSSRTMPIVSQLKNKTILVTGGARRLGKAIALAAAGAGANVAITYLSSVSQARLALEEIKQRGSKGLIVPCDVRKEESVALAVNKVADTFGGLDVLVNNAGMFASARFDEITVQDWDDMFAANVRGPFLMSKLCLPLLRKTAGRIIHMGSLGGNKPW